MRYALWMQEISTIIGDQRFRLLQPVFMGLFPFSYGIEFESRTLNVWDCLL